MRQCHAPWRSHINPDSGRQLVEKAASSFIVTFKGISDIIVSENIIDYETKGDSKWAIFQFICAEAPVDEPEILRPEIWKTSVNHTPCCTVAMLMLSVIRINRLLKFGTPSRFLWLR